MFLLEFEHAATNGGVPSVRETGAIAITLEDRLARDSREQRTMGRETSLQKLCTSFTSFMKSPSCLFIKPISHLLRTKSISEAKYFIIC